MRFHEPPLRVALLYVAAGAIWITVSDWLVLRLSPERLWVGQGVKGLLFVVFSGSLIYLLVERELRRRRKLERDRAELQRRLAGAQRLEAIGRLTAGIAHDFNNLLTAIRGNIESHVDRAEQWGRTDDELLDLSEAASATHRAEELTRQLLAFGRQQEMDTRSLDLNALIRDTLQLLQRLIGDRIDIVSSLADDLWPVTVGRAPLQQVVMNLALNARDAMPHGGRLTLATANVQMTDASAQPGEPLPPAPGDYVRFTVQDNGAGMDAETRERIYEPFFTRKEKHLGTGLGMSTVYGVVKQAGGHIILESREGEGTRFDLYFPRGQDIPSGEAETPPTPLEHPATGTVLVVEDEPAVRSLVVRTLRRHGFESLDCTSAAEALDLLASPGPPVVDLLLTDAIMPGTTGIELIRRARQLRPDLPVLLMSGYGEEELDADLPYLPKPFSTDQLLTRVRQTLLSADRST